ncbi:ras-associating and dilute domain-containing protein isoform X2 [Dunckerocampus dactyliophorus]|uniref:ras-associating and dilute domain-containing protein isoform X2 n=1 Tax=Dunckerocampus dactyliophorus TaxID=161453 RepID=UPI002405F4F5|nr:ras-associating and dilute domain-containing protein isoform X2 [Dunckerocampus dactyliophorus]
MSHMKVEELPRGLPASSLKRRIMRLGRKSSDGSLQSSSSTGSSSTGRSAEVVAFRQPYKNRIRRHTNRLSGVFLRGPTSGSLSVAMSKQVRKTSNAAIVDDPSELSNQLSAPGILKIFGSEICKGAHYKSVLATTHSSAKELVKEALERYGLGKEEASTYVLCDTIGSIGERQWKTEGFRVVGDNEKPLLLQSLWKPREGLARRFEIQRRSLVEEQTSKDKDTFTAGINAQARKLQKSRSRVNSSLIERTISRSQKLWRSKSEMDLIDADAETKKDQDKSSQDQRESLNGTSVESWKGPEARPEQNDIELAVPSQRDGGLQAKTETLCPPRPRGEQEGEESEREETESSDDNTTQYSIHPPHDCPYLLLLHGCSSIQDFVIYLLMNPSIVIGRQNEQKEDASKADFTLLAEDILPKHCSFHRNSTGGPTTLCPFPDAVVTRNGGALKAKVELSPGDVIGLGQSYIFLFKDPLRHKEVNHAGPDPSLSTVPWLLGYTTSAMTKDGILCNTCIDLQGPDTIKCLKRAPPFLKSHEGLCLTLNYQAEDEHCIVKKIVAMGSSGAKDLPPLTVAFLLCMCVQYSASRLPKSDLRRLLLLIASEIESAVWEQTNELAAIQKEILEDIIPGLFPLVVWMSNSLELLQFIQYQLPLILKWRTTEYNEDGEQREEGDNLVLLELKLSCVRSASEETIAALEEVIMLTFQQCVYYITKVLYPILPFFLDCNPFVEDPDPPQGTGEGESVLRSSRLRFPDEIQQVVAVLTETQRLLSDCQLHPEISTQLIGFLFYFINASLFNLLMERGSEPGFYQWSTGMRLWTNLDLLLSCSQTTGLRKLACAHTHALSSAINLLATPWNHLQQTSWMSLRSAFPALNAAQLNHLLSLYIPASPSWTPCVQDQAEAHNTDDILQSFDTHHPLVLPDEDFQFILGKAVTDSSLIEQLDKLKVSISNLSNLQSHGVSAVGQHQGIIIPTESRNRQETITQHAVQMLLSQKTLHHRPSSSVSPPRAPSSTQYLDDFSSCGALLLSQKLRDLQTRETDTTEPRRSALDPSCLLTPPNTPLIIDPVHFPREEKDTLVKVQSDTHPCSARVGGHNEDGFMFECLAPLNDDRVNPDYTCMKRIFELIEEEEEEAEEMNNHFDDNNDEIFSLEIQRDENGLGLALVDTRDLPLKVKGIFIRAVIPDTPAARCEKLQPGDRILAVNGVSLLGPHCQNGKELMQSSGDRLRLLVARSDWMAKAVQTEC